MNTYQATYWPPGSTTPDTVTVAAQEYATEEHYLVFYDDSAPAPQVVLSIPHTLSPVVQRTTTPAA